MLELPDRPTPARSLTERVRAWVNWVGVGRLVASAAAIMTVLAGGYWLVKPPAATTESKLPLAGASASTSTTAIAASTTVTRAVLIVHVAGAVRVPGVYELPTGARVIDAVAAAGGLAGDANANSVNLAALVGDGERVYVPTIGEVIASVPDASAIEQWPININSADGARLEDLPGVGPATAAAIIAYRMQHGPFASIDQLAEVRGIGPTKLDAIRTLVTV